jgi:hypothetical protein
MYEESGKLRDENKICNGKQKFSLVDGTCADQWRGEASGLLDAMLGKVADFFKAKFDEATAALSSLMEPLIMVIPGMLTGGLVVAMYVSIFKLGSVV